MSRTTRAGKAGMKPMVSSSTRFKQGWLLAGVGLAVLGSFGTHDRLSISTPTQAQSAPFMAGIAMDPAKFQTGDVLFRRGRSFVSRAVLSVDGGSDYSHVGLVDVIQGQVWILHALPAEETNGEGGAIAEPLSAFLAPEKATAAGLYRPIPTSAASTAVQAARHFVNEHTPFDGAFDLSSADKLYCTEMVWRAYLAADLDLCSEVPGAPCSRNPRTQYLLPSHLQESPQLYLVLATRKD